MAVSRSCGSLPLCRCRISSVWRNRRPAFGSLLLVVAAVVVVVGRGESGPQASPPNNLQVTSFDSSFLPPTYCWGLRVEFELAAIRCPLLPIDPCPLFSCSPDLFNQIKRIRRFGFMSFLWSRRRVGLGHAHVSSFDFLVQSPSFPSDVSLSLVCAGMRPIYIWGLTSLRLPLTSSSEARFAVPGRASSSVWPMVVHAAVAGKFGPSQRASVAGDAVSSSSFAPAMGLVSGSLKMLRDCGGASLVATGLLPRRRQGDLVSGGHAWRGLRHAWLRHFANASWRTARSPEASSAQTSACCAKQGLLCNFLFC